ncbi:unnamed protein product, partial [Linum tenue]
PTRQPRFFQLHFSQSPPPIYNFHHSTSILVNEPNQQSETLFHPFSMGLLPF